jgi:dipeptidyl-peptidase-4
MKKGALLFALFFILSAGFSMAQKKLTLEDIYQNNLFTTSTVQGLHWMKNGNYYTSLVKNAYTQSQDIIKYSTTTGLVVDTVIQGHRLILPDMKVPIKIDSYSFNSDETKLLIASEKESIYRRSSMAINYIYDLKTRKLSRLVDGPKQSFATFSPQGSKIAFVRDNNIYIQDLLKDELIEVTTDGKKNEIINGSADWVYEEELSLSKAFFWSPDGSMMAYLRFDEREVPTYNMQKWNGLYPEDYIFKYPKAGEKNSVVAAHVYDLATGNTREIKIVNDGGDVYLARMQWLPTGRTVSIIRMNRLQNMLEVFHYDTDTEKIRRVYAEKSDTYIDIDQVDDLTYLRDGKSFLISSEKSGFKHLYHYTIEGHLIRQITTGNWPVSEFVGINEERSIVYYLSNEISSTEKHLYSILLNGKSKQHLSKMAGTHTATFSNDFKYYISTSSNINVPPKTILHRANGKPVKILIENSKSLKQSEEYGFAKTTFFHIPLAADDSLNAYIMKPFDFDPEKSYPVLMYVYGGPGDQKVMNQWNNDMWHHLLTQHGYIVVCVDNRGTGGKGKDFQHITYKQLGKYESDDQIAAAKYISAWPFVDKERIGIWGWSYGGYLSSLCLFLGHEVFKAAIAVAPVTNWRYYDTIYTERYLQRPQDNPTGYDDFSPVNHAEKLNGAFLLIHGTGDDNVHFQNAVELQNALIKANKQFSSFFYPDRNHSIYGGNTRLHLYTMMTKFIVENL